MKTTISFKWYDMWIGIFVDTKNKALYFCPLPCVVIKFDFDPWIELVVKGHFQDDKMPPSGTIILAQIQHWYSKNNREVLLRVVDEDDVSWRTVDDNSELSYDWTVMSYKIKEEK